MLSGPEGEALRHASFTYSELGQTRAIGPPGYHQFHRSLMIGTGVHRFDGAVKTLLGWDMHRRAGVRVRPSSESVAVDEVAVLRLGWRALGVDAPVRVVYVIDEDRRKGFAYGTLPGHPESGEEAFVLERLDNDKVRFSISAFSRPASRLAKLGGPFSGAVQGWVTNRYLHAT